MAQDFLSYKPPRTNPYLSQVFDSSRGGVAPASGEFEVDARARGGSVDSCPAHWRNEHEHGRGQTRRNGRQTLFRKAKSKGRDVRKGVG